jgi:glycosyltransferase involved in cell wall biosynthesis
VPGLLGWFDLGLVPATPGHPYLSPLKLPEYLASGLPVVVARGSQSDALLPDTVKELYESGDAASLAAAILRLRDRADRALMPVRAQELAVARSWDSVAAKVAAEVARLAGYSAQPLKMPASVPWRRRRPRVKPQLEVVR